MLLPEPVNARIGLLGADVRIPGRLHGTGDAGRIAFVPDAAAVLIANADIDIIPANIDRLIGNFQREHAF